MNPYCRLIPRLNGKEIETRFGYYQEFVRRGVAGFILFGGELETVRAKIGELQGLAERPLIIASDLEQGLGQQVEGGTLFPPAMAVASAIENLDKASGRSLLERLYRAVAHEAAYAGINTILAPVLDINTNPRNPIIATRSFGEDPETVSFIGCEMIKVLHDKGILACGKHFPGHGDTTIDSHVGLPVIHKDLRSLEDHELVPFRKAVEARVGMVMLGHLSVPALDPSGTPATFSGAVVSYLRKNLGFRGAIITDAMNMGAIGEYPEDEASLLAFQAGVDLILHPTDPDRVASCLRERPHPARPMSIIVGKPHAVVPFPSEEHERLSEELTRRAVKIEGEKKKEIARPFFIILNEDREEKILSFVYEIKKRFPATGHCTLVPGEEVPWQQIPDGHDLIVITVSTVKAWKSTATVWLRKTMERLEKRAEIVICFGNPYVLIDLGRDVVKVKAFWSSDMAQKVVAEILFP